jgi:fibronectin-binding autotransporter adhesin
MSFVVNGTSVASDIGVNTSTPAVSFDIQATDAIKIPAGTTAERPGTGQAGMIRYNTQLGVIEYYNAALSSWGVIGSTVVATGGNLVETKTIGGQVYRIHYFTSTGTSNFTVLRGSAIGQVLVVGGGGAGGIGHGGGGAGGAVLYRSNQVISPGTFAVTVGAGGAQTTSGAQNNAGASSSAFGVTAAGGGSGANELPGSGGEPDTSGRDGNGGTGANGGGGCYSRSGGAATAPSAPGWTVYAGNAGGNGFASSTENYGCGGGGGAGAVGQSANSVIGGAGGVGVLLSITGDNWYWGGGGGGVTYSVSSGTGVSGNGGLGGGGGGCAVNGTPGTGGGSAINTGGNGQNGAETPGGNGGANTGGGGGGGANEVGIGGAGGSGVVIIRYPA